MNDDEEIFSECEEEESVHHEIYRDLMVIAE